MQRLTPVATYLCMLSGGTSGGRWSHKALPSHVFLHIFLALNN